MFRFLRLCLILTVVALASACKSVEVQLFAQSFPTTVHAHWAPRPASENVVSYKIVLNGASPTIIQPSACSATDCVATLTIPAAGNYTVAVAATNLKLSSDPTSTQDGPSTTTTFSVNLAPGAVSGQTVTP